MDCPKCDFPMEKVRYQAVEVDRCTGCRGLWFDLMELETLRPIEGSEAIDVGDPRIGEEHDRIDRIACPNCNTPMVRMVDKDQPHIRFEKCSGCSGAFLDAGEFRDLKDDTLTDFFNDLFARPRR